MLTSQLDADEHLLRFGAFTLDMPARTLICGTRIAVLTPKEFDVLATLVLSRGTVVSKDDLIAHAWAGEAISDSAVFQTVYRLRRTLARHDPLTDYVTTIPGRGYQFVAPVFPTRPSGRGLDVGGEAFSYYSRGMFEFHQRTHRSLAAAVALFRKAIRIDPQFAGAYVAMAHAHLCIGIEMFADHASSYEDALRACRTALEIDPNCGDAYAILSEIHVFYEADTQLAQRMAQRALTLAPHSWRVQTAAFWAFLTANDMERAIAQVSEALAAEPSSNHFTTLLGVALYHARRYEEAHARLMNAHLFSPADSMALFYDGCVLCFMGDYAGAEERFACMNAADRTTRVLAVRAWIAIRRGDVAGARDLICRIAAAPQPDDVALALALSAAGDLQAAALHVRRARDTKQTSCYLLPLDPFFEPLHSYMRC